MGGFGVDVGGVGGCGVLVDVVLLLLLVVVMVAVVGGDDGGGGCRDWCTGR